jgi:hypothetical protein
MTNRKQFIKKTALKSVAIGSPDLSPLKKFKNYLSIYQ